MRERGTNMTRRQINNMTKDLLGGVVVAIVVTIIMTKCAMGLFPNATTAELVVWDILVVLAVFFSCISASVERNRLTLGEMIEKRANELDDATAARLTASIGRALNTAECKYYSVLFNEIYGVADAISNAIDDVVNGDMDYFEYMDYLKLMNPYVHELSHGQHIDIKKRTA
jgi:hypothetical protein